MKVTREVILDLLPVYLAGEASPDTRTLVQEYLAQDPELERRVRQGAEFDLGGPPAVLPTELELRSLRRTRRLLALQRWLFAFAIMFSAIALTTRFSSGDGRPTEVTLLILENPWPYAASGVVGVGFWIAWVVLRRRLRVTR